MEFLIAPVHRGNPPISVPRTPCASLQRYDGGPWMSYPARNGLTAREGYMAESFDLHVYNKSQWINPTPVRDLEAFFQRWLYLGLIAEFVGVNESMDLSSGAAANETLNHIQKADFSETLDRIYKTVLVEDGDETYIRLDSTCLQEFLAIGRANMPTDLEARRTRYEHLISCLSYAHPILTTLPRDFNYAIRCSISALGELFNEVINFALAVIKAPVIFSRDWSQGFLNDETKISMRHHGWCPSDIARAESKYRRVQTLHIARMLDKSLTPKDHSRCTESVCSYYQINLGCYELQHQQENCSCRRLNVEEKLLTDVLSRKNRFPVLKLTGGLHDLDYEIVESGKTPYVAISHVWADGLGNPDANSLYRCKVQHLRSLVVALDNKDATNFPQDGDKSLIWLDTLCCPATDGLGKQMAIEKIRLVYQSAKHVLVLDAGLMAYEAKNLEAAELLVRIFTSGWMRRLWTLQEGALAKSLYFQFADESVSLSQLHAKVMTLGYNMTYRAMFEDVLNEFMGLTTFFHAVERLPPGQTLFYLDHALQYRGVSVPSDEPLCIATLMMLDVEDVLRFEDLEQRMQIVWQMLSDKNEGIPAQVIFFDEPKLKTSGWKWAPRTLLNSQNGLLALNTRLLRWVNAQMGIPTPLGLRVKFAGCKVVWRQSYHDEKPRHPWPGLPRLPESSIQFRDEYSKRWHRVMDNEYAALNNSWTSIEERQAYNKKELFPLHDIVDTNSAAFIYSSNEGDNKSAILVTIVSKNESDLVGEGIAVALQRGVVMTDLGEESYIYDVIEKLALQIRADAITDDHLKLYNGLKAKAGDSVEAVKKLVKENESFKASVKGLRDKMREIVAKAAHDDEEFSRLAKKHWGEQRLGDIWVLIQDFFRHDFLGTRTADDQVWFVD